MKKLKPYLSTLRLRAMLELQYRGAALGGMMTQLFFGFILVFLYQALYASGGQQSSTLYQTASYVWLQQAFFRVIIGSDGALNGEVMSGNVVYSLCRPVDLYGYWYMRAVAYRSVGSLMRALLMLPVAMLLPQPLGLMLPCSAAGFAAFMLSLAMGVLVMAALENIMSACTLITLDYRGAANMLGMFNAFAAGNLLPLTLFPDHWQRFILSTPFAQTLDVPIRYYTGQLSPEGLGGTLALQVFWMAALILIGWLLWRRALNRMVIQGG